MATQTTNYNLIKPDYTDPVDVAVLNDNADIIDSTLAAKANLVGGKVPASELPSYVDDVIEGYYYNGIFYEESTHTTQITPETGKIYIDLSTENCYRWSGSVFVQISSPESPIVEGYYYNGTFYEESAHTTAITPETGKIYIDLSTNDCYRWSGSVYELLSTPDAEIYWATYNPYLDAQGIADDYAELTAAANSGKLICMWYSSRMYLCSDYIGGVRPEFYFVNYDQFPMLYKITFSSIDGWSALSQAAIATMTYVDNAIAEAGDLPQGTNQDDILVWNVATQAWVTDSYPSGTLPSGTANDDFLVWDNANSTWISRAKGTITSGSTGYATGGDVYTAIGNIPQIPVGTNTGDVLVWSGSAWVAKQPSSPSRLPSAYQEVEYIESTGDAYIDTGYVPNLTTEWNLVTRFFGNGDYVGAMRHGRYGGGTGERFSIGAQGMNLATPAMELAIGDATLGTSKWGASQLYHTTMNVWMYAPTKWAEANNRFYFVDYSSTTLTFQNQDSLYLFRRHLTNNGYDGAGRSRVFYHLIREVNTKVQEFIPCYRKSDNEIGMYDLVTDTFFTNAGSGTFTKGADV